MCVLCYAPPFPSPQNTGKLLAIVLPTTSSFAWGLEYLSFTSTLRVSNANVRIMSWRSWLVPPVAPNPACISNPIHPVTNYTFYTLTPSLSYCKFDNQVVFCYLFIYLSIVLLNIHSIIAISATLYIDRPIKASLYIDKQLRWTRLWTLIHISKTTKCSGPFQLELDARCTQPFA